MAATIIDQLIVQLGLDDTKYKRGTDEAARRTKVTQETLKKSSDAMSQSLMNVTRQIAVMFIGFESASGLVNFLAKINQAQAALSRMSQNFGLSARALDVWDKSIELAGGSVQAAQGAINQLNQDVTTLLTQSQASPLLIFLNKLGIQALDSAHHARDAKTVYAELFAVLSKMPRAQAFQLATQAGVNPEILNFGLRSNEEREAITKEAERLSRATDASTKQADDLRMRWVAIKETLEGIGITLLEKVTPVMERLLPVIERIGNEFADWISSFHTEDPKQFFDSLSSKVDELLNKLKSVRDEIGKILSGDFSDVGAAIKQSFEDNINSPSQAWEQAKQHDPIFGKQPESALSRLKNWLHSLGSPYQTMFNEATEQYGLPAGLLRGIAQQESNMDPTADSGRARGLMGLNPKYFPDAGQSAYVDIQTAAKEMKRLLQVYKGNQELALAAYNDGQGNLARNLAAGTVPRETLNYVPSIMDAMKRSREQAATSASKATSTTSINIDNVTINTKATDGKQVAKDFVGELKKRDLLIQTDTGMVP